MFRGSSISAKSKRKKRNNWLKVASFGFTRPSSKRAAAYQKHSVHDHTKIEFS